MVRRYHILGRWQGIGAGFLALLSALILVAFCAAMLQMGGCTTAHAHRRTMTDETGRIVTTETDLGGTIIDSDAPAKLGGFLAEGMAKAAPFLATYAFPVLAALGVGTIGGGGVFGTIVHLFNKSSVAKRDAAYDEGASRGQPIIIHAPPVQPVPVPGAPGSGAASRIGPVTS